MGMMSAFLPACLVESRGQYTVALYYLLRMVMVMTGRRMLRYFVFFIGQSYTLTHAPPPRLSPPSPSLPPL